MNNLNTLIISAVFPPEPVVSAKLSFDIACKISKNNHTPVLCPNPSRPKGFQFEDDPTGDSFSIHRLKSFVYPKSDFLGRMLESLSFGKHCSRYISNNYKTISCIYANTWPMFAQYITVKAAKKFNIPIAIHVQDIYPEVISNRLPIFKKIIELLLLPIDRYVLQNTDHVIAISEKMKKYLAETRNINSDKISVVTNWQDESAFISFSKENPTKLKNKNVFTFMYLGNIGPLAGIDTVIEAFSLVNTDEIRLVISGSGSMKEELEKKAHLLNLKNIEFWSVPDGQVPAIQAQADVMLLPMKKGGAANSIPSKLPAYMFSAKPIIASVDFGSDTANAIEESGCGWVIEPESVEKLSISMKKAFETSRAQLERMGENGFEYAMNQYSKEKNLQKLINVINEISR